MTDGICLEGKSLLTDAALKALKPREKSYKVTDRDGWFSGSTARPVCRSLALARNASMRGAPSVKAVHLRSRNSARSGVSLKPGVSASSERSGLWRLPWPTVRASQTGTTDKSLLIFRNRVKAHNQKYSAFVLTQISRITPPVSRQMRGVGHRHERAVRCGGR
jgi:hypothetical protein